MPPAAAPVPPPATPNDLAVGLETYPLISLRSDLGEFLIADEKMYVQQALVSVERVIAFRMTDRDIQVTRIGAGNHRGDHGRRMGAIPLASRSSPERRTRKVAAGIADRRNHGASFPAIVRFSNSETTDVDDLRSASIGLALKINLERAGYSDADFLLGNYRQRGERTGFLDGLQQDVSGQGHQGLQLALREAGESGDGGHRRGHPDAPESVLRSTDRPPFRGRSAAPFLLQKEFSGCFPMRGATRPSSSSSFLAMTFDAAKVRL